MTGEDVRRLGEELGLDAVGVTRAEAYDDTERAIRDRRSRGLFAEMKFTMAQPEVSCHPETLVPGARSVVSAALCYWQPEAPLAPGQGRLRALHLGRRVRRAPREARPRSASGSAGPTACSSTRTSTSTARPRRGAGWGSTARTRC